MRVPETIHAPTPSEEGVAQVQALYRRKFGVEVSTSDARQILTDIMRILYAGILHEAKRSTFGNENPDAAI